MRQNAFYPFLGWLVLVSTSFLIFSSRNHISKRTILFTAPHAEFAPFQRVWNPDSNNDYTEKDFSREDEDKDEISTDDVAGADGKYSEVNIPAFNGEDYFDDKPIGWTSLCDEMHCAQLILTPERSIFTGAATTRENRTSGVSGLRLKIGWQKWKASYRLWSIKRIPSLYHTNCQYSLFGSAALILKATVCKQRSENFRQAWGSRSTRSTGAARSSGVVKTCLLVRVGLKYWCAFRAQGGLIAMLGSGTQMVAPAYRARTSQTTPSIPQMPTFFPPIRAPGSVSQASYGLVTYASRALPHRARLVSIAACAPRPRKGRANHAPSGLPIPSSQAVASRSTQTLVLGSA